MSFPAGMLEEHAGGQTQGEHPGLPKHTSARASSAPKASPRRCCVRDFGHRVLPCTPLSRTGRHGDNTAPAPSYAQVRGAHSTAVDVIRSL